ncbi:hypothetical protein HETIRDRAFT_243856, partial [Heterobasidion irregulare TC 32-1]
MTRTERAVSPRALLKDRSEARNGLDTGLRKGGAGAHNWGALNDEARFEREGADDEESEPRDGEGAFAPTTHSTCAHRSSVLLPVTEEDRENALKVRKNALKDGVVDLAAIARSSVAVS